MLNLVIILECGVHARCLYLETFKGIFLGSWFTKRELSLIVFTNNGTFYLEILYLCICTPP